MFTDKKWLLDRWLVLLMDGLQIQCQSGCVVSGMMILNYRRSGQRHRDEEMLDGSHIFEITRMVLQD